MRHGASSLGISVFSPQPLRTASAAAAQSVRGRAQTRAPGLSRAVAISWLLLLVLAAKNGNALSISLISVSNNSSSDFTQETGTFDVDRRSALEVLADSTTTALTVRYSTLVGTELMAVGSQGLSTLLDSRFDISLSVLADPEEQWLLSIDVDRVGSITHVQDVRQASNDLSRFRVTASSELPSLKGTASGISLASGSLDLPALEIHTIRDSSDLPINQELSDMPFHQSTTAMTAMGTGDQEVTLSFQSVTLRSGGGCTDCIGSVESAIRMGLPTVLGNFQAGAYPGAGARDVDEDGHFVRIEVVSVDEPPTLLLVCGAGIALLRRWRRLSPAVVA